MWSWQAFLEGLARSAAVYAAFLMRPAVIVAVEPSVENGLHLVDGLETTALSAEVLPRLDGGGLRRRKARRWPWSGPRLSWAECPIDAEGHRSPGEVSGVPSLIFLSQE